MKILFADKFPASGVEILAADGHTCEVDAELSGESLTAAVKDADLLVVRSTRVEAATLESAENLKMVIRAGAGTNTIDKTTAADKGVYVCNVPGKNAIAVAELTMGLLLSIDRRIPDNVSDLRQEVWNKKVYSDAVGIYGRSMGIVGLGAIGMAVAERAAAFGLNLVGIENPNRSEESRQRLQALGMTFVGDLAEMAGQCDIVSFHVPAAPETRLMVGAAFLDALKPGAILINTARGDIVDEAALIRAMDEKGVRAGLDVFADEPGSGTGSFSSALAQHPSVYGTHHIGASTAQAQQAVAEGVIDIVRNYAAGTIKHCVNMPV